MSMTPYRASAARDEQLRRERQAEEAWLRALERGAVPAAREGWIERFMLQFPPLTWPESKRIDDRDKQAHT